MSAGVRGWTAYAVVKFLKSKGFVHERTKGSHMHFRKVTEQGSCLVTVPYHGSKDIPRGTLNSIIRQSGIPKESWLKK